jgi:hypothetical protein
MSNDAAFVQRWDADIAQLSLASILIDTADLHDENKTTSRIPASSFRRSSIAAMS